MSENRLIAVIEQKTARFRREVGPVVSPPIEQHAPPWPERGKPPVREPLDGFRRDPHFAAIPDAVGEARLGQLAAELADPAGDVVGRVGRIPTWPYVGRAGRAHEPRLEPPG